MIFKINNTFFQFKVIYIFEDKKKQMYEKMDNKQLTSTNSTLTIAIKFKDQKVQGSTFCTITDRKSNNSIREDRRLGFSGIISF